MKKLFVAVILLLTFSFLTGVQYGQPASTSASGTKELPQIYRTVNISQNYLYTMNRQAHHTNGLPEGIR